MTALTPEQITQLQQLAELAPQLQALVACQLSIAQLYCDLLAQPGPAPPPPATPPETTAARTAVLRGDLLTFRGRDYLLTDNEKCVAAAFVRAGRNRLNAVDLEGLSGVIKPSRVLANLLQKYPELSDCIQRPGQRCRGGYFFNVRGE